MPLRLVAVTYDALDPAALAAFWGGLLGRDVVADDVGLLLPGGPGQVGLRFVAAGAGGLGEHRLHLHLTSGSGGSGEDQREVVERVLARGGHHLDVGQLPEEDHVVLADPEGNRLCVIEPGNRFLAGCGPLGEVTCDGTREVGVFWGAALGWPLVWDEDGETAVQSPEGGTKVSWGGPPIDPKHGRNRQRLDLVTSDVASETDRLVGLGAAVLSGADGPDGAVELADPDGNELHLRPS